jgi:hypothetical protein
MDENPKKDHKINQGNHEGKKITERKRESKRGFKRKAWVLLILRRTESAQINSWCGFGSADRVKKRERRWERDKTNETRK